MIVLSGLFTVDYFLPCGRPGWKKPLILHNGPTTEGVNYLLNTAFRGSAQKSLWYCGIINNAGYSGLSASDTLASHSGWGEFTNGGGDRKLWTPSPAAGGLLGGSVSIQIIDSGTIKGIFLASEKVIGAAGLLYSTAVDPTGRSVTGGIPGIGGRIDITYALTVRPRS